MLKITVPQPVGKAEITVPQPIGKAEITVPQPIGKAEITVPQTIGKAERTIINYNSRGLCPNSNIRHAEYKLSMYTQSIFCTIRKIYSLMGK
jgi:hypothetical protein